MILGLDLEGEIGLVTEVGLADGSRTLSCQWTPAAKRVVKQAIKDAEWVVTWWGLGFDYLALAAEGVHVPIEKQFDAMVAFRLLFPAHRMGLGHALPLLIPTEPGKHLDVVDPQAYNRWDVKGLPPAFEALAGRLRESGMWDLFINIEQPFWRLIAGLGDVWYGDDGSQGPVKYSVKRLGKGATISPAGEVVGVPQLCWPGGQRGTALEIKPPPGKRLYALRRPNLASEVVENLAECRLHVTDPAIDLHVQGYGPVQINRLLPEKIKGIKAYLEEWDLAHPAYTKWVDRVEAQIRKDGYIVNPFGRRCWTRDGSKGRQFLVASTVSDIWKWIAADAPHNYPYAIMPDGLALLYPTNFQHYFDQIPLRLTIEAERL